MSDDAKPDTWMPLVIGDYKKDTGRLTRDLHGGYLLLIMEYWTTGPLLDDDAELAAIVLATPREWKAIRPKLERFFRVEGGFWRHKRIDAELAEATVRKARNAARARAAADARWGNDDRKPRGRSHAQSNAPSIAQALPEECPASPTVEVDGPSGQSTLYGRERPEARPDGASGLRVIEGGPDDSERGWRLDAQKARTEASICRRKDPELSSELEEFAAYAEGQAADRRRMEKAA